MRGLTFVSRLVLSAAVIGLILVAPAAAKKPPKPAPAPPPSTSNLYVKSYASVVDGKKCSMTPEAVVATSDGGSALLALSDRPSSLASESCSGVNWLVKLDAFGNAQWQRSVGCFNLPPGSYSYGVSLQQTVDGGYVLGGGTLGCGSDALCPFLSGRQCAFVEKLDATGNLVWARVYASGANDRDNGFWEIRQTSDGGFVGVGQYRNDDGVGAWTLKLDSQGNVQWQQKLGPAGRTYAYLDAVRPTADGGYVAAGRLAPLSTCQFSHGCGWGVLVVKLRADGSVDWQRGFNSFDSSGAPTASESVESVIQASDGGYLVAGTWGGDATVHGEFRQGPLLLKLDATGSSEWQKVYSAGVHCFFGVIGRQCAAIGGLGYSVQQTSDGGYAFAGAGHVRFTDSVPLVPSLTKTDASGNLLWQHFYYETYPSTGRTLSQYFASSALTSDGGHLAVGFTENPGDFAGELFAVRTDSGGRAGSCSQIHPATPVTVVDPGLAAFDPGLPVHANAAVQGNSPSTTQATSLSSTTGGGC